MSLINCKVELKRKWRRQNDNVNANDDSFYFTIKNKKLHFSVVNLSVKEEQKLSKPSREALKGQYIGMKINKTNKTNYYRHFIE